MNWGKTSISLNISKQEDLQKVYDLIIDSDIVITSYKPGDATKLKVNYDVLSTINPKLIYGDISGYTSKPKSGYDAIIQAESGFMYMNGQKDSPPTKMPVALIDILTAHQLKEGILVALLNREHTGKGDFVEVSLFDSAISSLSNQATNWLIGNKNPERIGSEHPNIVPYGTVFYDAKNQPLVLAIGSDKHFSILCQILTIPEIAINHKFKHNQQRVVNRIELISILTDKIKLVDRHDFLTQLEEKKSPAGAVHNVKEALETKEAKRLILEKENIKGVKNIAFRMQKMDMNDDILPPPIFQ